MNEAPAFEKVLTCIPTSRWGWRYDVQGVSVGPVVVKVASANEGSILWGKDEYTVSKKGWLAEKWSFQLGDEVMAEVVKPAMMLRSFDLSAGEAKLNVSARAALSSIFDITERGSKVGIVRRTQGFGKNAVVECDASVPELTQVMCFWIAVLCWKRAGDTSD